MMRVPRRRIAAPAAIRDAAERSLLARKAATTSAATASSLSDNPGDEIHGDLLTSLPEEGSPKAGSGASPRSVANPIVSSATGERRKRSCAPALAGACFTPNLT